MITCYSFHYKRELEGCQRKQSECSKTCVQVDLGEESEEFLTEEDSHSTTVRDAGHALTAEGGKETEIKSRCPNLSNRVWVIVLALVGLGLYGYDVFSDVILAEAYSREVNHTLEFTLTVTYTVVPTVICNFMYAYHFFVEAEVVTSAVFFQMLMSFPFMLGSLVRYTQALIFGCRNKDTRKLDYDAAVVSLVQAYLESASQLIIQVYFVITADRFHQEDLSTRMIRKASMVASASSLAWALVSVRRANRLKDDNKKNDETKLGSICNFLARISEITPRLIVITLFASQYHVFTFVFGEIHYAICLLWILVIDKTEGRFKPINIFLKIVISYVMIFCFVDLDYVYTKRSREHIPTRLKMGIYYFLFYIENWVMFTMWVTQADSTLGYFVPSIVIMTCCMIFHLLFLFTYYKFCHPKSGLLRRWSEINVDWLFYYSEHSPDKYVKAEGCA